MAEQEELESPHSNYQVNRLAIGGSANYAYCDIYVKGAVVRPRPLCLLVFGMSLVNTPFQFLYTGLLVWFDELFL